MAEPVSVCGLYIMSGVELRASQTGLYHVEVVSDGTENDCSAAISFTQNLVREEALSKIAVPATFFVSSVHPGWVSRRGGLDFADNAVDEEEELDKYSDMSLFTVCGLYADNCETYCDVWSAKGPKLAYFRAWEHVRNREDRELLVTCVHNDDIQRFCFPFADPTCTSSEMMVSYMQEFNLIKL